MLGISVGITIINTLSSQINIYNSKNLKSTLYFRPREGDVQKFVTYYGCLITLLAVKYNQHRIACDNMGNIGPTIVTCSAAMY